MTRQLVESLEGRQLLAANLVVDRSALFLNDPVGGAYSPSQTITVRNTGDKTLTIPAGGVSVAGGSASRFKLTLAPTLATKLAPGASTRITVAFSANALGPIGATLQIKSDAPNAPVASVNLRGLGTKGLQGNNEPSLQWILDTYQIPVNVGDSTPEEGTLDLIPQSPNDETELQFLRKAGPGDVTIEPLAIFSGVASPGAAIGWYGYGADASLFHQQLYTVPSADVQTLNVRISGTTRFDPGDATFGIYTQWAAQNNRIVYSENFRNSFIEASRQRMFRWYPLKNADGSVVPNAYVVGNEEAFNNDLQDGVFIVRNVMRSTDTAPEPIPDPVPPPPPPPPPAAPTVMTYQAENAILIGAIVSNGQAGYTGSGFADFQNASGDVIRWNVEATGGTRTISFRYANGSTSNRAVALKVNGVTVKSSVSFGPTGSWTTWKTVTLTVSLLDGANAIELVTVASNGANIDSMTIS